MKQLLLALALAGTLPQCAQAQRGPYAGELPEFEHRVDSFRRAITGQSYLPFQLTLQDGRVVNNANLRGKVVLLDFWFEFCHPCHAEFGGLNALHDLMATNKDFALVTIALAPPAKVPELRTKYALDYDVASADDSTIRRLNYGSGYPVKFLLDKEGKVRYYATGGGGDSSVAHERLMKEVYPKITALLKEKY